jgi:hypothetical protein
VVAGDNYVEADRLGVDGVLEKLYRVVLLHPSPITKP